MMTERLLRQRIRSLPRQCFLAALLLLVLLLYGCAGHVAVTPREDRVLTGVPAAGEPLLSLHVPRFVLLGTQDAHNRVGGVEVRREQEGDRVVINSDRPAIYAGSHVFSTATGTYVNLVYRIHFAEIPFRLVPFHLGAGNNVGVLVVITLDERQRPLLVTTANTCGCYAVTIPTATLPVAFYPEGWPSATVPVYGETLPARLERIEEDMALEVVIREDVHRVKDLAVVPGKRREAGFDRAELVALASLRALPRADGTTISFYHERWPLTGHVKGAVKPWESVLLSLVSLDLFVGMDKEYTGVPAGDNPFYTSLKPWNRSASDMNDFTAYLRFNGWKL